MKQKRITIFTPTYNRKHLLPRLYDSLKSQDTDVFLWLIVDDGSTDDTFSLVKSWIDEECVEIVYHYQNNGGKMRAHNMAVSLCETELFVCIDSDDYLASPYVIKDTVNYWDKFRDISRQTTICGVVSYKKMVGVNCMFPTDAIVSTLSGLYDKGFKGETTLVFKTDVIRKYPFPVEDGEKFITEAIVYDLLDMHYQLLLFPYYSQICEYQEEGYTRNGMDVMLKNPKGYRSYYNQLISLKKKGIIYHVQMYIALSLLIGDGKMLKLSHSKMITLLIFPLGVLRYFKLKRRKW